MVPKGCEERGNKREQSLLVYSKFAVKITINSTNKSAELITHKLHVKSSN